MKNNDLTARAFRAYFRSGVVDQPANVSGPVDWQGKRYVVLSNINGVMAVYRVSTSGRVRRLRSWPDSMS